MISWSLKKFDELTPHELYAILRLRSEVFVVEQNCVFQDMDNKDQLCWHLMGHASGTVSQPAAGESADSQAAGELIAYTRLVPAGVAYKYPSIGRVVIASSMRGTGTGKLLMEKSIEELFNLFGESTIRIGAQLYLKNFYRSFGFEQSSEVYDEDGIDHIEMTR